VDLLRTNVATAVYVLGLAGPGLLVAGLTLLERAGLHLGMGAGLIVVLSVGACVTGAVLQPTTTWKKWVLVLMALVAIPLEILALGAVFLMRDGLAGTQ